MDSEVVDVKKIHLFVVLNYIVLLDLVQIMNVS